MAYWSTAASIIRRSLRILDACERLRARKNPGTAIAASNAMIATTIMISTRVKPPRRLRLSGFNMFIIAFVYFDLSWEMARFSMPISQLIPCHWTGQWQANESSDSLRTVRGPEGGGRHVRERVEGRGWNLRQRVDGLRTVGITEEVLTRIVEDGTFLQVSDPVSAGNLEAAGAVGFNGILVDGGVDHTQIIEDFGRLRAFTCAQESWDGDRGQQCDDCHYDHDFHEGKTPAAFTIKRV